MAKRTFWLLLIVGDLIMFGLAIWGIRVLLTYIILLL